MTKGCPSNTEVKKAIQEVVLASTELDQTDLREAVAAHMNLDEEQRGEKTENGGNRFNIRFSTQLSELGKKGVVRKEGRLVSKA
jgi:hypothetical protein